MPVIVLLIVAIVLFAVLLLAVLHFIPDADDPYGIVKKLMDAVPAGSFLVVCHAPSDINPGEIAEMTRRYNESGAEQMRPRSREEIMRFFEGLEMIPPGLAPLSEWLPRFQNTVIEIASVLIRDWRMYCARECMMAWCKSSTIP